MSLDEMTSAPEAAAPAEPAAEEAPKKRTVRRTKKTEAADAEQEKAPVARKTRTRKAAAAAETPEADAEEPAAPRRRVRRKADAAEASAVAADEGEAPAEKPKRRRTAKAAEEGEKPAEEQAAEKKPAARKRAAKADKTEKAVKAAKTTKAAKAAKASKPAAEEAVSKDQPAEQPVAKRTANAGALARRRRAEKASEAMRAQAAAASPAPEAKVESKAKAESAEKPVPKAEASAAPASKPAEPAPQLVKYGEEPVGPIVRRRPGRSSAFRTVAPAPVSPVQAEAPKAEKPEGEKADDAQGKDGKYSKYEGKYERRRRNRDKDGKSDAEASDERRQHQHDRADRDRNDRNDRRNKQKDNRQNQQGRNDRDRGDRDRDRNDRGDRNDFRRQRRENRGRELLVPKTNKEELAAMKVAELRAKAAELELDVTGLKKAELVEKVYEAAVRAEGFIEVEGILDTMPDGYGFLRTKGYLPSEGDIYVGTSVIRRNNLRKGDYVKGQTRPSRENEKYAALQQVLTVNGTPVAELGQRIKFADLTPIFPDECLTMEHGKNTITARVIDLVSPIGKGQRGLIVSPPKAGKTTVLKDIAAAISANNPEVHLMCLLVDERPEEVTDMQRSIKGEVIASTFDMPTENHITVSELVIERAKRLVERGEDVVVLLDSLTRLARAYNLAQPASGRILSGGVDSTALYPPKKFLGAARNIEGGGSLTILASALVETGSKMDEVIFEEFKGTGNMELKLDRYLADRRIFPAIDPISSGTRKEDLLLNPQEAPLIWAVRRFLANVNNTERATDSLIRSLKQTKTNEEFLLRFAKKNQTGSGHDEFGVSL